MSLENEQKLTNSIKRHDMFAPLLARELKDGSLEIIGGEHRAKIAVKLGLKTVPVVVLQELSDNDAKEIGMAHNSRYGSDDVIKLSELMNSLDDAINISDILPLSEIEIETLMSATQIDLDSLTELNDEEIDVEAIAPSKKGSKTHTIMRFKVPIEDAEVIEALIKTTIKEHGLTEADALTNAGDALVQLLLSEDR
jgi:ParB-like chromosome segregation protein Spo0J